MSTPIEPQDIRVGDTVRKIEIYAPITVEAIGTSLGYEFAEYRQGFELHRLYFGPPVHVVEARWELVSRPEPPREPGTTWQDPDTKVGYIRTDSEGTQYVAFAGGGLGSAIGRTLHAAIIARLVPWTKP